MQFGVMYLCMTTEKLYRLGFTKDEVRRGERCCLTRIARGRYVATGSCDDTRHETIWAALSEGTSRSSATKAICATRSNP